jgi:serralysin
MAKVSYTYDQAANKIATIGWASAATSPISYGFRASDDANPGFVAFTSAQICAAEQALQLWSDVANIKFQRSGSGTSGSGAYTNNASILFSGDTSAGGFAWAYFAGSRAYASEDGDVYINPMGDWFSSLPFGSYDYMSIVHEVGHAIGLDHPGAYNGGSPTYAMDAEYAQDSMQYTLMSYFDAEDTGASHQGVYAATPLLHDIAAAQLLYGINWSTRSGNTTYGFNSNADRLQFHIDSAAEKVVFAIWDGGGVDTLDFSGYGNTQKISLIAASFSSTGGLKDNIAIARGAAIENAKGGSGADTITGNGVTNRLWGLGGNDTLAGGTSNDILNGGAGADAFVFNTAPHSGANNDWIQDFNPIGDTIRLENAVFTGLGTSIGSLSAGKFWASATGLAHDSDDRIVYKTGTGQLFYDADGNGAGAAVAFATLTSVVKPVLAANDFSVI